jgi:signal peptidase I
MKEKKKKVKRIITIILIVVIVPLGSITLERVLEKALLASGYEINRVVGESMVPSLKNKQMLISKTKGFEVSRYDIVTVKKNGHRIIKRVYGLPGETIHIDNEGNIYIDGDIIDDSYVNEKSFDAGIASEDVKLGKDEYFVMGDNRNNSTDSRDEKIGAVKSYEIVSKVIRR